MQGSLGEKIGEGAYSEAYVWAPDVQPELDHELVLNGEVR